MQAGLRYQLLYPTIILQLRHHRVLSHRQRLLPTLPTRRTTCNKKEGQTMQKNQLILSVQGSRTSNSTSVEKSSTPSAASTWTSTTARVLAIVGESGSGKSRVHQIVHGSAGRQRLHFQRHHSITTVPTTASPCRLSELTKEKDWLKVRGHEIAMIMQDPMTSLNPLKTIGDQIMEAVELHQGLKGKAAKEKTLEYLRDVGITDAERPFRPVSA